LLLLLLLLLLLHSKRPIHVTQVLCSCCSCLLALLDLLRSEGTVHVIEFL
jgi:hypothetical protein